MKTNRYSLSDRKGTISIILETQDTPTAEDFDSFISMVKERYPELNRSTSETEKESEEVEKKPPLQMNQKEYERWRTQEEKRNKKNR